jgi:hypothetical protein
VGEHRPEWVVRQAATSLVVDSPASKEARRNDSEPPVPAD